MFLIPPELVAFISLLATLIVLVRKQYENFFTRLCVTLFYATLALTPIDIEVARELNRWFWILVLGVEVVWWIAMTLWRRSKDKWR